MLKKEIAMAKARGKNVPAVAVQALLNVPASVLSSLTEFADEPAALEAWRLTIAAAVEAIHTYIHASTLVARMPLPSRVGLS